jgi:uncharacterized membrane protein YidH (DUF202 family)
MTYILAHWIFSFKYFIVSLLLHFKGALPKNKELCKTILNGVMIALVITFTLIFGSLRWYESLCSIDQDMKTPSYLAVLINSTQWVLLCFVISSLLILLVALILIAKTLRN